MGRKKLDIKYIDSDSERKFRFKERIGGLIKKVHELGVLCGIKASLVVTDYNNNLVVYSNNNEI
jgi:SRF-type transcription factor (DNA-binding and dimerisation domain)